jgi:hypothetical protein
MPLVHLVSDQLIWHGTARRHAHLAEAAYQPDRWIEPRMAERLITAEPRVTRKVSLVRETGALVNVAQAERLGTPNGFSPGDVGINSRRSL